MKVKSYNEDTSHTQQFSDSTLVDSMEVKRFNDKRKKHKSIKPLTQEDYSLSSVESESLMKKKHIKKKHSEKSFEGTFIQGQNMFETFESEIVQESSPGLDRLLSEIDVDNPFDESEIISVKKRKRRDRKISTVDLSNNITNETSKDSGDDITFTKVKKKKKRKLESNLPSINGTSTITDEAQERLHDCEDNSVENINSTMDIFQSPDSPKKKKRKKSTKQIEEGESHGNSISGSANDDCHSSTNHNAEPVSNNITNESSIKDSDDDITFRKVKKKKKRRLESNLPSTNGTSTITDDAQERLQDGEDNSVGNINLTMDIFQSPDSPKKKKRKKSTKQIEEGDSHVNSITWSANDDCYSSNNQNAEPDSSMPNDQLQKYIEARKKRNHSESADDDIYTGSSLPNSYPSCKSEAKSDSDISISDHMIINDPTLNDSSYYSESNMEVEHEIDCNFNETQSSDNSFSEKPCVSPSRTKKEHDQVSDVVTEMKTPFFNVNWELPDLHRIVDRASKPTPEQRTFIAQLGLKVKYGKFNKVEDQQIIENWKQFLEMNKMDSPPATFFHLDSRRISKSDKAIFLQSLARNLPERTLFSVFRRFKILMSRNVHKTGRFTEEENEYIQETLKKSNGRQNTIAKIASHLNRTKLSIENHIRLITNPFERTIKWRNKNAAVFIKYLLKYTKTSQENIQELKNKPITIEQWRKLSSKLDGVPVKILKSAWYEKLHTALFIPKPIVLSKVKRKIVEMFIENAENDWRAIDWKKYATRFDGFTHYHIYNLFFQAVHAYVPLEKRRDLKACLRLLKHVDWKKAKRITYQKITYKDGEVTGFKK